ncbi:MAG: hypothetical protein KatS3mg105_2829 [Gemmatales bacterium]|nr:MAG: hypothetical protein KatS3mg105_2829 [Gemmatales bacterium]
MEPSAKLTSIDALRRFKGQIEVFGEEAKEALSANEMEIQRAFSWLEEQLKHWQKQLRIRQEEYAAAKKNLAQRKMMRVLGRRPDCSEQEEAFERAARRLREAEQKLANSRRWGPLLRRAVDEYQAKARLLQHTLEIELVRACAQMEQRLKALEEYTRLMAPATPMSAGPSSQAEPADNSSQATIVAPDTSSSRQQVDEPEEV